MIPVRQVLLLLVVLGALGAAAACSDDKDEKIQKAIGDHATILCDQLFSCCTESELQGLAFVDQTTHPTHEGCVGFHTENGQKYIGDTNAEEAAERISIHVDDSAACAEETRGLDCKAFHARLVKVHLGDPFALCNPEIVEPLVANGGPCRVYFDCVSGYCEAKGGGEPDGGPDVTGTCKALPRLNERCPGVLCADGLRCDPDGGTCVKLSAAGNACLSDAECASGACNAGRCVSPGRCGG